jgi:hypothetical protein
MNLKNLDNETRQHMLDEIGLDKIGKGVYFSERLRIGYDAYLSKLNLAAATGSTDSFSRELIGCFNSHEIRTRQGRPYQSAVPYNANETLAEGEFNRFYMRAVCLRAIANGSGKVRVYRAKIVQNPRIESQFLIGKIFDARKLLDDLRINAGIDTCLGLPPGPNSGLSIELLNDKTEEIA